MRQIPVLTSLWSALTEPALPSTSLSISAAHLAMITLRRASGGFTPRNLGVQRLPAGLIQPSFLELNVADETALIDLLKRTATQAGITRINGISATLPSGSVRCQVLTFDALPSSRDEIAQTIEWKIERVTGQKAADLRIDYRRLRDLGGRSQWIFSAVHIKVLAQYEAIFRAVGWRVGLLAPQFIGESQWLIRQGSAEDQIVLSLHDQGFDAVVVRDREPILIREVVCSPEEREDEFYRLMIFYRDRLASAADSAKMVGRLLTIGGQAEQQRFRDVLSSALERPTQSIDPKQLGLKIDPNAPFNYFAGAGGLATMAWS